MAAFGGLMSDVRAKMVCTKIEMYHGQSGGTVRLTPVMGTSLENKTFWKSSPSGAIELNTINPDAFARFALGEEYYVDFTRVSPVQRLQGEVELLEHELKEWKETGKLNGWNPGPERLADEIKNREKSVQELKTRITDLQARG